MFNENVISKFVVPFTFTLLGKFVLRRPNLDVIHKPLQMDQVTATLSRLSVAHILVEIDVSKKHPKEILLRSELHKPKQATKDSKGKNIMGDSLPHAHSNRMQKVTQQLR
ncbi:hypothetical protein IEQ34_001354 [Dendrobium chrysotoxum]|uniref:Uncharacterized protein n=1 Tax=Dendrobium chrysotoxum TaxID=161865 RepID=A0AAV7HLF3_DENCH|nr:hypothetical protein IEQ34_001354 [Dendrobium chrysotoxum]